VLGAFFIGAVFILEKSQNTLEGLFITPFKIQEYIFSKVVSLTLISVLSSSIIALVSLRDNLNIGVLLTGVILTSVFYTLLGFIIAVYSKTTNQYFINSIVLVVFLSPIVEYLNIFKSEFFMLLPGKASLVIIDGAFKKVDTLTLTFYTVMLLIWCIFAYTALEKAFYRKIVLRIGG
jgi:fluoroquinolone transport system permease protein